MENWSSQIRIEHRISCYPRGLSSQKLLLLLQQLDALRWKLPFDKFRSTRGFEMFVKIFQNVEQFYSEFVSNLISLYRMVVILPFASALHKPNIVAVLASVG